MKNFQMKTIFQNTSAAKISPNESDTKGRDTAKEQKSSSAAKTSSYIKAQKHLTFQNKVGEKKIIIFGISNRIIEIAAWGWALETI